TKTHKARVDAITNIYAALNTQPQAFVIGAEPPADPKNLKLAAKVKRLEEKAARPKAAGARRAARTVAGRDRAEWRWTLAYIGAAALVFAGFATSQHFWSDETMAVWGATWRVGLIIAAANFIVLGLLDWSLRGVEKDAE